MSDEPRDRADRPGPGGRTGADPTERPAGDHPGPDAPDPSPPFSRPSADQPPAGARPPGGKPGAPYRGGQSGGRPYGGKPGGPYRGGGPRSGPPASRRADGGRPAGRPYGGRPQGRPDDHPHRRDDRPPGSGYRGDRPRRDGPSPERRPYDDPVRRVDHSHRERRGGPPPARGPWARDAGPRGPRGDWERRDRYPSTRPGPGPVAAEVLAEDEEIVAGRRPVEEAFAARREAKRLLVVPERRAALDQLVLHATTLRIPVVEVEGGTITAVSGFDGHQGVALVVAPRRWATLDEVLALARSRNEPPFLLALDHLEDPQNVGTLLRSAEACGVHGVIFPTRGAAPLSPAAIKTSAGAIEHLLLVPLPDLAAGLVDLHARGVRVIGADGDAPMTVRELDMRGPIVIVTGSEGRGLNAKVRKRVDLMARIPMRGKVASLNASVAGSVFLFEAAAQRDLPEAERQAQGLAADAAGTAPPEPAAPAPAEERPGVNELVAPEGVVAGVTEEPPSEPRPTAPAPPETDDLLPEAPPAPRPDESA